MADKTLNLRGLKCPLPALRARKALGGMAAGDLLTIECTDPLTAIDIPNLLRRNRRQAGRQERRRWRAELSDPQGVDSVVEHHDLGADRNAVEKVDHIVIDQAEAA